jgi:hypothetical protein
MAILFWVLPISEVLHIIEEFIYPGGFRTWYRNYRQHYNVSATPKYLIIVNSVLIILSVLPLFLDTQQGPALWLSMASVVFFNSIFHIQASLRSRRYSPGMVTSILLYIPISIYGYWYFISLHITSEAQAVVSSMTGIVYLIFSVLNHKRRARRMETSGE